MYLLNESRAGQSVIGEVNVIKSVWKRVTCCIKQKNRNSWIVWSVCLQVTLNPFHIKLDTGALLILVMLHTACVKYRSK